MLYAFSFCIVLVLSLTLRGCEGEDEGGARQGEAGWGSVRRWISEWAALGREKKWQWAVCSDSDSCGSSGGCGGSDSCGGGGGSGGGGGGDVNKEYVQ